MNRKALIDTNVLLDACMSERPEWAYAVMLLDEVAYGRLEAHVAATSLKDAYYILGKYADEATARQFVTSALDAFVVQEVNAAACRMAAQSNEPDFEDGVIRACAERAEVAFIISRDEEAFKKSHIKRLSAKEYVELFCPPEETEL